MTRDEEHRIIDRVLKGDVNTFELFVTEYEKNLYNLALRMCRNPEDAADMTQEAFIKAYNSLSSFRGDSKFSVWLYRIASNVCLDFLRRQNRHPSLSLSMENDEGESEELDIPDEAQSPQHLLEQKLTREAIDRGLGTLSPDQRQILLMREIQGLSYDEISQALSLEAGTVKSRIFRARKKLCAFLVKDGNIPDSVSSGKLEEGETP